MTLFHVLIYIAEASMSALAWLLIGAAGRMLMDRTRRQ